MRCSEFFRVIVLLFVSQVSSGQTLDKTFALFTKFYSLHDSTQIEDIGNRILFFDSLDLYREKTEQMIGRSLEFAGHYKAASYHYKEAIFGDNSTAAIEGLARCQLATQNYYDCLKTLEKLESPTGNLFFLTASAYYGLGRMDTCEILFGKLVKNLSAVDSVALHKLLKTAAKNEKLNPIIARNLSIILPGLGQLYAGDIKNGINSMALNAFLIWGFIHTWQTYSFIDSYISVFPWFQRYYIGSAIHARDIAEKKKARKKEKYFDEIVKVIAF